MTNTKTNDEGLTFEAWLAEANTYVIGVAGVGIEDLSDGPSYDAWADSVDPTEYAQERLLEDGFPEEAL